mmetsp:Transcript_6779/g.10294  ORF Transcript_6779/g.10294 Transcript_6779/m.10294 type:complete len:312 (-) Transcript_6779:712-1647(-)
MPGQQNATGSGIFFGNRPSPLHEIPLFYYPTRHDTNRLKGIDGIGRSYATLHVSFRTGCFRIVAGGACEWIIVIIGSIDQLYVGLELILSSHYHAPCVQILRNAKRRIRTKLIGQGKGGPIGSSGDRFDSTRRVPPPFRAVAFGIAIDNELLTRIIGVECIIINRQSKFGTTSIHIFPTAFDKERPNHLVVVHHKLSRIRRRRRCTRCGQRHKEASRKFGPGIPIRIPIAIVKVALQCNALTGSILYYQLQIVGSVRTHGQRQGAEARVGTDQGTRGGGIIRWRSRTRRSSSKGRHGGCVGNDKALLRCSH